VTVPFQATPTAPSSYILARQLGSDTPLMAAILMVQRLAAMVILPVLRTLLF
jgi:malonate transporter and related proteins